MTTSISTQISQEGYVLGKKVATTIKTIPSNVGVRDGLDCGDLLRQIGTMTILSVSGGRKYTIYLDATNALVGIEFPVSAGYKVRAYLANNDTYTVQRVLGDKVLGQLENIFFDEIGETVYRAGMYVNVEFGGHSWDD